MSAPRRISPAVWVALLCAVFAVGLAASQRPKRATRYAPVAPVDGWYEGIAGYDTATQRFTDEHKPLFLYFHTTWCQFCKRAERDLFPTAQFREGTATLLKVRINPEADDEARDLADKLGVKGYPTVIYLPFRQQGKRVSLFSRTATGWLPRPIDAILAELTP